MNGRIDAHQHFWKYSAEEYPWISEKMSVLRRDFGPADLAPQLQAAGITGTVAVQARQSVEETDALLQHAARSELVKGVVGWVPLLSPAVGEQLAGMTANPLLKGVRHVVHDEPDDNFILREDFNRGVGMLRQFDLVYDVLIFERHLKQTLEFVDRHPQQQFVIDHVAKPRIRDGSFSPWRELMHELSRREHVTCKISGMVTEACWDGWNEQDLAPYIDSVLEAFGPGRLMFGSDWPVLTVASTYERWVQTVEKQTAALSADEQRSIWEGTARRIYKLGEDN